MGIYSIFQRLSEELLTAITEKLIENEKEKRVALY